MYKIRKNSINGQLVILDKHSKKHYDDQNNEDKGKTWSHDISQIRAWSTIPI